MTADRPTPIGNPSSIPPRDTEEAPPPDFGDERETWLPEEWDVITLGPYRFAVQVIA